MVSDFFDIPYGGSTISTKRFADRLIKRGNKVVILTTKPSMIKKDVERRGNLIIYRFPSFPVPFTKKKNYFCYPVLPQKIQKIFKKERIDIIHICLVPSILSLECMFMARFMGLPIVATHHVLAESFSMNLPLVPKKTFNTFFYKMVNEYYNHFNLVIGPCRYTKKILKQYGLKTKAIVISNGINLSEFNPKMESKKFLQAFNLKDEDPKILFIGRLSKEKGVEFLIDAFVHVLKRIPDAKLIIVGTGFLENKIKQEVNEMNLRKNIIITGFISDKMLKEIYASSNVFVLPSSAEFQPLVLLEAIAMGLPVIGTKITGIPELVINNFNGFTFEHKNSKDLVNKIIKILTDKNLQKKFSRNSLILSKKHDIKKSIDKLEKVYLKLINS